MLDFVKKIFGLKSAEPQESKKEEVIDAVDMTTTTKIDGIGHETVKAAKKAPAKPKTAAKKAPAKTAAKKKTTQK
jgi:hypothetical protein